MALSEVSFEISKNGIGIQTANEDATSAIVFTLAVPNAYGTKKVKAYNSIADVETDGMTALSVTYGIVHYHASEFFRMSPGSTLWIGFNCSLDVELYTATNGKVRQIGVFTSDLANVGGSLQTAANTLANKFAPAQIVVGYKPTGVIDLSTLPDCGAMNAKNVSVVIVGSGSGVGAGIATSLGIAYEPAVGTVLGTVSSAAVNQNIGEVGAFRMDAGDENAIIRLVGGTQGDAVTESILTQLDTKQYIIFRKYAGYDGNYIEKDWTSTLATEDYSNIRNNRTMQKAIRNVRAKLLPKLKARLRLDSEGKIAQDVAQYYENLAKQPLKQMQIDEEVSDFQAYVNPEQNVLSTNILVIELGIIPTASPNQLKVKMGFVSPANFQ